ncbi:MAG: cyclic nucleotide-binding and patatin-like phospholipase domain-containing protein [Polyangia bacterium]
MDPLIRQMFLSQTPLWGSLPAKMLAVLARDMKVRTLANGETLIRQGDEGRSLFIVVDGRLEARLTLPEKPPRVVTLGHIRRGEVAGEMAVLSEQPRMCTVVAVRESRVLELARSDFLAVVAQHPEVLFALTDEIIRRRTEVSPGLDAPTSVALIPQSPRVDIDRFASALRTQLEVWGKTGLLRERDVPARAGDALGETLNRFERGYERVIYQGHAGGSQGHSGGSQAQAQAGGDAWTRSVMRQADLILLVADADADPKLSELERTALFGSQPISAAPVELVLLHKDGTRAPLGTSRWLEPRRVRLHHHIAPDAPADLARLARLLTGNANQLVLSGGGVRGFAHIGVLRALDEARIPVDFVGGTSVGAGIAAFCAMRYPARRIQETLRPFLRDATDLTLPMLALSSGRKATQALQKMFGSPRIEDLWLSYFAISADLQRAEEYVHRTGPVWQAVRASTSLPGIYPPVPLDGRYLIDGGVINNLPVDVMAGILPGRILEVDVSLESTLEFASPPPMVLSGWRLLLRRLNPFRRAPRDPSIADVLMRAGEIACVAMSRINKASTPVALSIRPPIEKYRMLDFQSFDAIIEDGYRHARELLPSWEALLDAPRKSGLITLRDNKTLDPQARSSGVRISVSRHS